jgi:hypothetical protein
MKYVVGTAEGFNLNESGIRIPLNDVPLWYEHTYSSAERPAACDLIRGKKAVNLFPQIKSEAAGCAALLRSAVCVFIPLR